MTRTQTLREAFREFKRLLDDGFEWPDAAWRVADEYNVSEAQIAALYEEENDPMSNIRYPIGTIVINVNTETDHDENNQERVTPTGSYWRVWKVNGDVRHLDCADNGAWISPDIETLDRDFKLKPENIGGNTK